ncbi:MAG: hypothetical protein J0H14_24560 [Alphaproteobacteria bacterium]|nr:hypothetical protein [Alphaproteobacteria bacterium]
MAYSEDAGQAALAAIDRALEHRPEKDGHDFADAAQHLAMLRDAMTARYGDAPPPPVSRERLARLNAILSVVLGGHFPLGSIPWHEIELARGWLADLLGEKAAD